MGGPEPAPAPGPAPEAVAAAAEVAEAEAERTVKTFAAVSFLHDAGSDMVFAVWPLFMREVLKADMAVLGLVDGLGDAMVSLSSAAAGYVSDRIRRRKVFIWPGYLMGGASRIGYALSTAWPQVIPFKVLDRAGKIRSAPKDAIVADISDRGNRGRRFGFLRAMDNLGAVAGILFAIAFVWAFSATPQTYRNLFMVAAIPSVIGALMVVLMIKERPAGGIRVFKGLRLRDLGRDYRLFLLLSAIFAVSNFSYSFFLIFASVHDFQDAFVPVLYLTFTAVAALVSIPFGHLADTWGRKRVMTLSLLLWAGVSVVVLADQGFAAIVVAFVLYGAHKGALEPVQRAFVSELAPSDFRSSGLGAYQMVVGLCALPASLIAGFLWDAVGAWAIFAVALALTLVAVGMLQFVREAEHGPAGAG